MSYLEARDQLRQAADLIKAGDMRAAQTVLRPLCEANRADAWWLLAQTTQSREQIQVMLQKALAINPHHGRALQQYTTLFPDDQLPEASLPARKPKEEIDAPKKKKGNPGRAHSIRLLMVGIGGLVIGLSAYVLISSLVYTVPPPVLGPYYQRITYPYGSQVPAPCNSFLVFGQVVKGAGLAAHLWIRDFDRQVTTDAQGNFQFVVPRTTIVYEHKANNHQLGDVPVKFQLLAANGAEQSGIHHLFFGGGCAVYVEYWHESSSGLKLGVPALRPPSWSGPYDVSYSQLTTTSLLVCDFTGFTGTAYDASGPMKNLTIQLVDLTEHGDEPEYIVTNTGSLEAPMGPSWWYIFAKPEHTYFLQVLNPYGEIIAADILYLPKKQGCEANLIEVSIMQAEQWESARPPILPEGWARS